MLLKGVIYRGKTANLELGEKDGELDLKGYHVFECFVDSHIHIVSLGLKLLTHDLEREDLGDLLKREREKLIARGWEDEPPLELINSVDYPVALIRKCGHKAIVNDKAKELLGLSSNVLYESDVEKVYDLFTMDDYRKAFELVQNDLFRVGISYVHSDDLHGLSYDELVDILKTSKLRIYEKLAVSDPKEWMFGRVSERVEIGAIKVYADGSIGARTAYMKQPYTDTGDRGRLLVGREKLREIMEFAKRAGVEVTVHIIGDGAMEELAPLFHEFPGNRIIHAQFVPESTLPLLKRTRFSVQPHFHYEDQELLRYVRTDSLKYPFLQLHRMGYDISFSSDAPVSPHDPRYVAEAALRMGFTKEEVFKLYTKGSRDMCVYESDDPFEDYPILVITEEGEVIEVGDRGAGAPPR